ncbi:MAG TPA: dihydrolipoamide acetyltransferase family protein [Parafilimonas sp.]|nr:dihydrolipoamide acetyltransferase family protein [Parafilimonas sp.]
MAIVDLVMPKLGESIMEATILKWHKKPGDTVQQDETVLDIATDKVDSEVPSTAAGKIAAILFKENEVVPIGSVIAKIETDVTKVVEANQANAPAPVIDVKEEDEEIDEQGVPYVPVHHVQPTNGAGKMNRFYSPLVMNIANSEGVSMTELERIPGTGNEGRVTKRDILHYVQNRGQKSATRESSDVQLRNTDNATITVRQEPVEEIYAEELPKEYEGNVEIIEMDRMRKLIAKHMVSSKHISAHVTSFAEADVTNMVLWREKVKKDFEKQNNTKITFTPMFIDCLVRVMKRYPIINSSVDGDRIIVKKDLNIGMATALPSGNLIVPVIKNADELNLVGLSKKVNNLADAARNNKLKPDNTADGTFTLTNVGTFGSLMGTPIINQPQVAILAVGAIKKRAVVIETEQGDTIGIRHMMYLSLSYDHRIVDGSLGASFLTSVAKEFEKWDLDRGW